MAADTAKQWSIREDGCLSLDVSAHRITYNSSLNSVILSCKDHTVTVLDALSGAFLQKSDLSGDKKGRLECTYLPDKDKTVFCDSLALGVRGDLQGILLLDTALQTAVSRTEDLVKVELPLAEASQLLKTLLSTELSNKDNVDDFKNVLAKSIQKVQEATQGNHKTAKWATVTLQMQHQALRSACSALVDKLTKSHQTGQGFPVASAIVDRLGFLLPSSRLDIMKEPVNRALMYSEAARRETFANWPHMNYKWALPEPMAQAGFFHHPNREGDDRAMCFTCNVCLVCWEPTDEPWSEHERHSQLCPYIKGDYTQNVPLTVTYATQPAQFHDDHAQQKIACLSATFNEDFIATSTSSGNITVWDISYILKKHCQFDIDLGNALVALMTGLHIEASDSESVLTTPNCGAENVENSENMSEEKGTQDKHSTLSSHRPLQDLCVTSLCVADETKWRDEVLSPNPTKPAANGTPQLSLICGVTLRCAKPPGVPRLKDSSVPKGSKNQTVQLMNEVNEAVSSDAQSIPQLITDTDLSNKSDFQIPQGRLAPCIVVVSLVEDKQTSCESSPTKKKSLSPTIKPSKEDMAASSAGEHSNSTNYWSGPWEDGLDPDCQIVGFTPSPGKSASNSLLGMMMEKHIQELHKSDVPNGPSDLCDNVDTIPEPSSPDKRFFFSDFTDASISTPAKEPSISSFHNMSGSSTTSGSSVPVTNEFPTKVPVNISGAVIQCLELPSVFQKEQIEVRSILPSIDKQHVIIILSTKVGFLESTNSSTPVQDNSLSSTASVATHDFCGGGILVYRLRSENSRLVLEDEPVVTYKVKSPKDVITSSFLLPPEVEDQVEDEIGLEQTANIHGASCVTGHLVLTTAAGVLQVMPLAKLSPVAELTPGPSEKYICATYCSGVERLTACTDNGKLKFFDLETVSNRRSSWTNPDHIGGSMLNGEGSACKKAKMDDDAVDHSGADYLINQPLNGDTLKQLHELIQFENLMPRFTAVVPPCWSEIQQEQQQRRHPQHLQQQGESTQHTRTWKLTTDALGQTWDEHLFELLLPKPCSVGHVDIKFSLHPMCTLQPNLEVTLLKQNIGSVFCPPNLSTTSHEGKSKLKETLSSQPKGASVNCDEPQDSGEATMINPVLDPEFLKTHNAEILCGPIKLANCLDLTGSGGLITLSSPQLFSSKPRSLLLHIKGFENSPFSDPILISKEKPETDRSSTLDKKMKFKKKTLKGLFDSVAQGAAEKSSASERQKLIDVKGCDWFQEVSVTVRIFKKTNIKAEKQQRHMMIMDNGFHRRLIELITSPTQSAIKGVSPDHLHCMALDILLWMLTVQMNDVEKSRRCEKPMLEAIQSELKTLVKTCLILSPRTTAHKFSRLLAMCMESSKYSVDKDMAPAFSYAVMQALLACYPLLPLCSSSGALRWFFILLNRAKCMDVEMVAQKSCELLLQVSEQYKKRNHHLQALLKTRYGLYGNPFEAELFDLEPSNLTKPQGVASGTTPGTIFTNGLKGSSNSGNGNSAGNKDQSNLFDLLMTEKNFKTQPDCLRSDILGLLEVEPLHFRCHATSDGTRMERMDATSTAHGPATTSSTFNAGLSQLALQGFGVEDIPTGDITTYMAQATAPKLVTPMPSFLLGNDVVLKKKSHLHSSKMYGGTKLIKPTFNSSSADSQKAKPHQQSKPAASKAFAFPQIQGLLQTPPPQVLVIERMHSGARRFVTLDFGKRIVLTDIIIPSSMDLASLSIDVWVEGEEVDGQRLIVASDIGHRTLVMNNIMPAPVCRYLKITTVARCSGGTTRSRIPLGSFFGHTYILPWELPSPRTSNPSVMRTQTSHFSSPKSHEAGKASRETIEEGIKVNPVGDNTCEMPAHASLLSQLALFLSLLEDLQCRFSLARTRLESLLTVVGNAQFLSSHVQYHLKRNTSGKLNEEDAQIIQAYNECLQLQVQLNLAQHAIRRLQTSLGIGMDVDETVSTESILEQTSTDKLRVILESLLDTLLTSTVGSPAIPKPPTALYVALTPSAAQALFQHLCIHSPQRVQVSAGLLLVRVCGTQPWWGHFLGNIMQEFFHAHFNEVFPQDRVFLLLSAMGQKSLCGPSAGHILDSLLAMLSSILARLTRSSETEAGATTGSLDLSLISWILLFLCRNMEGSSFSSTNSDDGEKNGKKEKEGAVFNNRWGFIESQWSPASGGAHGKSQRIYRRGFQKKVALYKQKFHELDKIKILGGSDKKNTTNSKNMLKRNQLLMKLFNDRTKGESSHDSKDDDLDAEPLIMLSRERCLSVARGLMALLLNMDFTCHVDLFLITCKVLAKICVACRPSVSLAEAMSQEQLEQLVLLVVDTEFNHNSMTWGGPWAAHAITCLLQDILEGKKTCSMSPEGSETEMPDVDDAIVYLSWMEREGSMLYTEHVQDNRKVRVIPHENVRSILRNRPEFHDFVKKDFLDGTLCLDEKDNPAALGLLFLNKSYTDKAKWKKFLETVTKNQVKNVNPTETVAPSDVQNFMESFSYPLPSDIALDNLMYDNVGSSLSSISDNLVDAFKIEHSKNVHSEGLKHLLNLKNKLTSHMAAASGISLHLSTALDARLEFGLETMPEHRLKMMQSVQLGNVQCAFTLPLPPCPVGCMQNIEDGEAPFSFDGDVSQTESQREENSVSSVEMLSTCFEHMFARLRSGRVSLESVLQLWLTLNEDHLPNEDGAASSTASGAARVQLFDATRQPIIALSENAVASLMEVGVMMPSLMVRTWVFLLQSLCLLTNQRHTNSHGVEISLAPAVLRDPNLAPLLTKFLCSHPPGGSASAGSQLYQVGPAAVKILGDLLHRLQCKSIEVNGQRFKEMLLKIVYNLIADRGAIYQCSGPIDAQVQFLEMMSESPLLSVDVSNALSVIQAASTLVYQHLSSQDQVVCHTNHDTSLGAQSCFGGLVASLLRGSDSRPGGTDSLRDQLMFFLLQLVNKLISAPMNSVIRSGGKSSSGDIASAGDCVGHKQPPRRQTWADPPGGNRFSPRLLTTYLLSDDEKSRTRNQQSSSVQSQDHQPQHQLREADEEDDGPRTVSEVADIVVSHPVIMRDLIQALSHCTSNKLALMFAHTDCLSSLQKSVDHTEAVTVGDLIFTILRNLKEKCSDRNIMVDNLFHFFAEHPSVVSQLALTRLSEPLLFYTLRILNSFSAIKRFIDLGGISVVGRNLVRCSQQMISSSPSIISTLMQNFSSGHIDLGDKNKGLEVDNTDGLQSFAQLGTITCSSPTAVPADGLVQPLANRRARSATWSYHFYPDEPCVELTIHLPFAVLLKYVHIRPHAAAISSCPSHVSLELSHDGNVVTPTSPPLLTSSLTLIRLQLQKPQVVTSVTLLLHRPLDSTTIGLQRISLWGQTAFAESTENTLSHEDGFSRSSLGWMRILHHCLHNSSDELQNAVAQTAALTPNLLSTCTSLLLHPVIGMHAPKIETILIRLGLSHKDISLSLLNNILRQPAAPSTQQASAIGYLGKIHGVASPHTVEIIYKLGTTQDEDTQERVAALLHWLEDCAKSRLAQVQDSHPGMSTGRTFSFHSGSRGHNTLCNPSPEHVQCVAAVLWHSMELPVSYPLQGLVSVEIIRLLYDWSGSLVESNLRKAINNVLCSACHICYNGFMHIQEWMGIVGADGSQIVAPAVTQNGEDSNEQREALSPGRMTDDSKEATKHPAKGSFPYSTDGMTDDSKEARRLQSFSSMCLDKNKLMMLAAVCKCPTAIQQLKTCGLPAMLAQAVCEFCNQQMLLMATIGVPSDGLLGEDTASLGGMLSETSITATLVSAILRFFTEISSETELKDWLGQAQGNAFWSRLLTLLCGSQYQTPVILNSSTPDTLGLLSAEERSELESRTIEFFSTVISFHTENQLLFAKVLCDVIKDQGTSKTDLASAMPLSGFMRRLLLQVLLEDEKIVVAVRNTSSKIPSEDEALSNEGTESFPLAACSGQIFHPRYGSGRGCQCITMNLNAKCSDVISKVADTLPMSSSVSDKKDDKKKRSEEGNNKEAVVEQEEEIMDFLSRLAASAKEKREKSPATTTTATSTSGLPPRPPTRRGRLTQGSDSLMESVGSLRMPQALYRARLRHMALLGKDLPHNLALSQLLHVLSDYGFLPPTLALQFVVRYRTPGSASFRDGINDTIASDEILLAATPFPSALKMFASVGGLALLAEHLPLLFPEITRQSNNVEVVSDASSVCDISADWVTVESSDEFYDPYEPLTPPHVAKTSKNSTNGPVPSIPPHSLIAFGLFLRLPGYADVLLKERKIAQCLIRLVLGVTDDGDGGQILTSPAASSLPTMPFTVLRTLFDASPLTTDDGVLLRRMALDIGVVHLVLACLATLSHHKPRVPLTSFQHETQLILTAMQSSSAMASLSQPEEKSQQHYWAKGTGFGTGSTTSSWDAEQAMLRQKGEEEHVACLLQVLASYMNPNTNFEMSKSTCSSKTTPGEASSGAGQSRVAASLTSDSDFSNTPPSSPSSGDRASSVDSSSAGQQSNQNVIPDSLVELLSQSCLVPALSSYLRNDSVLDMARHVPLYRALLQLLRGITSSPALVPILLPMEVAGQSGLGLEKTSGNDGSEGAESQTCIETLLEKMKGCVDTYASRLKSNKGKSTNKMEDGESEGLALLIPDIQETARLVRIATQRLKEMNEQSDKQSSRESKTKSVKPQKTLEHKYLSAMKELQFDTYEMVTEEGKTFKFHVSHHYESNVKATGTVSNVARTRRLAQEAVTLSTSLPLAFSSSVFVRCDEERLDVMKVLITGPSDTPYANGCFEFDVFFPHDYPNTPPFINMETTGNHSVRFNPNLYNDGKVCLSILNTWHGRPEEKWNAQTSSFLQVLVSIQSLILVSEPYFNEPGYERSRGTPPGQASSHEYDANIRQATVKWAMLEQLKNPSPCFKEIIHTHFWLKRNEILQLCETWMTEMEGYSNDKRTGRSIAQSNLSLRRHYNQLREELAKLKPPPELEEEEELPAGDTVVPPKAAGASQSCGSEQAQAQAPPETEKEKQEGTASASALLDIDGVLEQPLLADGLFSKQEELFETDSPEEDSPYMYLDGGSLLSSLMPPSDSPFIPPSDNPFMPPTDDPFMLAQESPFLAGFPDDMSFDTDPEC